MVHIVKVLSHLNHGEYTTSKYCIFSHFKTFFCNIQCGPIKTLYDKDICMYVFTNVYQHINSTINLCYACGNTLKVSARSLVKCYLMLLKRKSDRRSSHHLLLLHVVLLIIKRRSSEDE